MKDCSVGVDVGGTKISIGLVDESGGIIDKSEIATGPDYTFTVVGDNIALEIDRLLNRNGTRIEQIENVGFGIPGTTASETGVVGHAPNLGWKNVPFGEAMARRLPSRLFFVQETHAAVLAEYLFGAAKGCDNVACVAIGTGIGCGLIIDGKLHRGAFNTAGEFGHLIVVKNGNPCSCGRNGCIEAYGSGSSIRKIIGCGNFPGIAGKTSEELFAMAVKGRKDLEEAIVDLVEYIGMGLVNIINLLSPEKILLTGGLADQEELVVQKLRDFVLNNAYSLAAEKVDIEKAALGRYAPMIGAAVLHRFVGPYTRSGKGEALCG